MAERCSGRPQMLPLCEVGSVIVVEERWHGLLWSAVPHRVVCSDSDQLVTYVPAGTIATRASNRGMAGTEHLSRDERKVLSLRTRQARVVETVEGPDRLFICRAGRWSRISLGWRHDTGELVSWYVNFELPATATATGIATMDLVADLWVNPDRTWEWKDRADLLSLVDDRTLDPSVRDEIDAEFAEVIAELSDRRGPFADHWLQFRAEATWPTPVLPASHSWHGRQWAFETGPARS